MQFYADEFVFLAFFLITFSIGWALRGYYGRNSPDRKKSLRELKRQPLEYESRLSISLLGLFGLLMLMGMIVYVFFVSALPWMQLPIPLVLRWAGVILGVCSLPLIGWVQWTLGASFSKTLTIQEGHELITSGPYSRVRHPMYLSHTFWFFSWILITTNLLFALSWILWIGYVAVRVPQEEAMLIEKFGDQYRAYMKKTGALLPKL